MTSVDHEYKLNSDIEPKGLIEQLKSEFQEHPWSGCVDWMWPRGAEKGTYVLYLHTQARVGFDESKYLDAIASRAMEIVHS